MVHNKLNTKPEINIYKQYYKGINGGIDGYYEKTILEADYYEVFDKRLLGYFTIHKDRGLTSLIVFDGPLYNQVFDYVISLPLVAKILFSENDKKFMSNVKRHQLPFEKQAINFEVNDVTESTLLMKKATKEENVRIYSQFNEFIDYNNMDLDSIKTFYHEIDDEIISFGALEPMVLNDKRYCLVMIVNENYRKQGFGKETVKFLINHLTDNKLEVNGRCYIKNDASKNTLLASGLKISNYLYKVENFK